MNHINILKRAWKILWSYRALWVFGIILALTSTSSNNANTFNYRADESDFRQWNWNVPREIQKEFNKLDDFFSGRMPTETYETVIYIIIGIVVFFVAVAVVFTIARYVSRTALIRMVDQFEESAEKVTWREGFRLGWSNSAWRLFLVDLVIFLPVILVVMVLIGCAAIPVILTTTSGAIPEWPGIIATIGLAFVAIFVLIILFVALSLFMELIYRDIVLGESGVMEGIRQGWNLLKRNFIDVFLLWLIQIGIHLAFFVVILPIAIVLIGLGLLVGGGSGFAIYQLMQTSSGMVASIVSAVIVGVTFFFLILAVPVSFISGLKETYLSTVWTLAYRQVNQPHVLEDEDLVDGLEGGSESFLPIG